MSIVTVVTPELSSALTTVDAVKAFLGLETCDNTLIADDIKASSRAIVEYLGRKLGRSTVSERFSPKGRPASLTLSLAPIVAVTSVTECGTALETDHYARDDQAGMIYRLSGTQRSKWGEADVVVVYQGGYLLPNDDGYEAGADDSLPADIERACIVACQSAAYARGRDPMLKSRDIEIPGVRIERTELWAGTDPSLGASGLPVTVEAMLKDYRTFGA